MQFAFQCCKKYPEIKMCFDFSSHWLFPSTKMAYRLKWRENSKQWLSKLRISMFHRPHLTNGVVLGVRNKNDCTTFIHTDKNTQCMCTYVTSWIHPGYFISVVLEWNIQICIFSKLNRTGASDVLLDLHV